MFLESLAESIEDSTRTSKKDAAKLPKSYSIQIYQSAYN